jgi:hypothetical protein
LVATPPLIVPQVKRGRPRMSSSYGSASTTGLEPVHDLRRDVVRVDAQVSPSCVSHPALDPQRQPAQSHLRDPQPHRGGLQRQHLVVRAQLARRDEGVRAEHARRLLVHGGHEKDVAGRRAATGLEGFEQVERDGEARLHVAGAPTVDAPVGDDALERRERPSLADRHGVHVGEQDQARQLRVPGHGREQVLPAVLDVLAPHLDPGRLEALGDPRRALAFQWTRVLAVDLDEGLGVADDRVERDHVQAS